MVPDSGFPSGEVVGDEHVFEAGMRVAMEQAHFHAQHAHVVEEDADHVLLWAGGARYTGTRRRGNPSSTWTTAPAGEIDDERVARCDAARRSLSPGQYQRDVNLVLDRAYLRAETPEGGSGFGGTAEEWRDRRHMISEAIETDCTFLDVGCANGHLMDSVVQWCAERGITVEPFGVDISPALVQRARERLPRWWDHIWVGDALTWTPPRRFDVVHALFDFVPAGHRRALVDNLLTWVEPGGRLVLSQYGELETAPAIVEGLGFAIDGVTSTPTSRGGPSVWLRKPE